MSRSMVGVVLAGAIVSLTTVASLAQTTTSSSETKNFEVLAVDGNQLDVRLPEGTRELTVADDFRFTVNGQQMSVHQLKPGMKGTATITTKTTVTPVTVTEIKNGTVVVRSGAGIIVRTGEGVKSFTQGDVDKRGVKIVRDGQPVQLSELREGDRLSAVIITSLPPKVMTEREVNATLAAAKASGGTSATAAPAPAPARSASSSSSSSGSASSRTTAPTSSKAPAGSSGSAQSTSAGRTLPKTASSWPLVVLMSALSLAIGFALTLRRRLA
jgi:hypothetical protein